MFFDSHIHTIFSTDSKMTIEESIATSEKLGLGINITEHMDLAYPKPQAFIFDQDEYFEKYAPYRSNRVRLGVELGMRIDCLEEKRKIAGDKRFDFVIGSIHVIDNVDIYDGVFFWHRCKKEVYDNYFNNMIDCLKESDFIHSLGHIDYIARYALYPEPEIYYEEYREKIDTVLSILASRDQAIEINTRRLNDETSVQNMRTILKRFASLKGRLVTLGSDAHQAKNIGYMLKDAAELAKECGLSVVCFKEGRPQYVQQAM